MCYSWALKMMTCTCYLEYFVFNPYNIVVVQNWIFKLYSQSVSILRTRSNVTHFHFFVPIYNNPTTCIDIDIQPTKIISFYIDGGLVSCWRRRKKKVLSKHNFKWGKVEYIKKAEHFTPDIVMPCKSRVNSV